jgi:hypothetical protein
MNIKSENIEIKDLILWDENARFPDKYFNADEKELIKFFISKPLFNIKEFILEITKDFDLPQLEKLVVWNDNGDNIVLEGNRRLTAYKLLINPSLTDNKKLQDFLIIQKEKINISENSLLECLISENKEDITRYIDRKHNKGNNEVYWEDGERALYNVRQGTHSPLEQLKVGIIKIVRGLELPDEMKDQVLSKGFVTTFFRFITSSPAKKKYGYSFDNNGDLIVKDKNYSDELKILIFSILKKADVKGNKIDSRTHNKTEKIEEFIHSVDVKDVKKIDAQIKNNTTEDIFGDKTVTIGKTKIDVNPNSNGKSKQIPTGLFHSSDVPFKIKSSSLRILYDELRLISVKEFPNATHDLLRSFLECSLIFFFKENNEFDSIQKSAAHNPKLGEMLSHIINKKCFKVNDINLIETLKQIKTDFDQPYSLERMNMINHNENCASTEKDVRKTWAQLESLFKIILTV